MSAGVPATWVAALGRGGRWALAICSGLVLSLGQAPFDFPYGLFLALPTLYWLLDASTGKWAAATIGWLAGLGYFALTLSWLVEPFLVDVARHGWMAPFALTGMAGGLALFWGAAFGVAFAATRSGPSRLVVHACAWAVAEWLRGSILTGFPWALLSYGWVETPVAQLAAWVGPYGLTLLTLLAGLLPALGRALVAVPVLALVLGWGLGAARLSGDVAPREERLQVRLVQPNAAQHLKWRDDLIPIFYERQIGASAAVGAVAPDVVIWPETAVPFLAGSRPDLVAEMTLAAGAPVIYGLRRLDETGQWFNSLAVATATAGDVAVFDKAHLVPFGEYMPLQGVFARMGVFGLAAEERSGFTAGPGLRVLSVAGLPAFLPLICYEVVFPNEVNAAAPRADWIVQITNDAWFGSLTGPYQHLAQARMRAIEQGLPLARAANTGVSAMIDAFGRVVAEVPLGTHGFADAALPPALPPTVYARFGDLWFAGLLMLGAGLAVAGRRRRTGPG